MASVIGKILNFFIYTYKLEGREWIDLKQVERLVW